MCILTPKSCLATRILFIIASYSYEKLETTSICKNRKFVKLWKIHTKEYNSASKDCNENKYIFLKKTVLNTNENVVSKPTCIINSHFGSVG